jgi:hypothetical protein
VADLGGAVGRGPRAADKRVPPAEHEARGLGEALVLPAVFPDGEVTAEDLVAPFVGEDRHPDGRVLREVRVDLDVLSNIGILARASAEGARRRRDPRAPRRSGI